MGILHSHGRERSKVMIRGTKVGIDRNIQSPRPCETKIYIRVDGGVWRCGVLSEEVVGYVSRKGVGSSAGDE